MPKNNYVHAEILTIKTLEEIVAIIRKFVTAEKGKVSELTEDRDALSSYERQDEDHCDLEVLIEGKLNKIFSKITFAGPGPGPWAFQVYVTDLKTLRGIEFVAIGETLTIGEIIALGAARKSERKELIKRLLNLNLSMYYGEKLMEQLV